MKWPHSLAILNRPNPPCSLFLAVSACVALVAGFTILCVREGSARAYGWCMGDDQERKTCLCLVFLVLYIRCRG